MPKELNFAMDQLSKEKYDSLAPSNRNTDMEYIKEKHLRAFWMGLLFLTMFNDRLHNQR